MKFIGVNYLERSASKKEYLINFYIAKWLTEV